MWIIWYIACISCLYSPALIIEKTAMASLVGPRMISWKLVKDSFTEAHLKTVRSRKSDKTDRNDVAVVKILDDQPKILWVTGRISVMILTAVGLAELTTVGDIRYCKACMEFAGWNVRKVVIFVRRIRVEVLNPPVGYTEATSDHILYSRRWMGDLRRSKLYETSDNRSISFRRMTRSFIKVRCTINSPAALLTVVGVYSFLYIYIYINRY